jgi:MraZ protein
VEKGVIRGDSVSSFDFEFEFDNLLTGEFTHSIDSQRRFAVPKDWRTKDTEGAYVIIPDKNFLHLYPIEEFAAFYQNLKKLSFADKDKRRALAVVGSQAKKCKVDKQGRIKLSKELMEIANLGKNLVLVGAFNTGQIWNPEAWEEAKNKVDHDVIYKELGNSEA